MNYIFTFYRIITGYWILYMKMDCIIIQNNSILFSPTNSNLPDNSENHNSNKKNHRIIKSYKPISSKKYVESIFKSLVPKETIESYNTYIEPLDNFKDMTIECNNIDLDENGNFTNSSIKVGPINVKSPQKMTFDEYANLYTNSLNELLINTLKNENSDEKEVIQELQNACEEVYLQDKKKNTIVK